MRRIIPTVLLLIGVSCGGSTENPWAKPCKEKCTLEESHPCAHLQSACIADCMKLAADATAMSSLGKSCGQCIVDIFGYHDLKPNCTSGQDCCNGLKSYISPGDPGCVPRCNEPDAGVPW